MPVSSAEGKDIQSSCIGREQGQPARAGGVLRTQYSGKVELNLARGSLILEKLVSAPRSNSLAERVSTAP